MEQLTTCATDIDPWSKSFLENPFPGYDELRELGPVTYLTRYKVWCTTRYAEGNRILEDWKTFTATAGNVMANLLTEPSWRKPSMLVDADPPDHTRARKVLQKVLSLQVVRGMRASFDEQCAALVDRLIGKDIDAQAELADYVPLRMFADAVGIMPDGRENLPLYGSMVLAGHGPKNEAYYSTMAHAAAVVPWVTAACARPALRTGGLGDQIYICAAQEGMTEAEGGMLVRSFLSAGVDTTASSLGQTLVALASMPDQWQLLREDPSRARAAFEESLRWNGPATNVWRTTTCDTEFDDVVVPAGSKISVFLHGCNHDPRQWENPGTFDLLRPRPNGMSFGGGVHNCVGQMLARFEAECLFTALARQVERIELFEKPALRIPNGIRGYTNIPARLIGAAK